MSNFSEQLKDSFLQWKQFQKAKQINPNNNGNEYLSKFFDTTLQLRGGGCSTQKTSSISRLNQINAVISLNFAANLDRFIKIIVEKSNLYSDKIYRDEIIIAFQWFFNHKEYFQVLCNDQLLNPIKYELIEKSVEKLTKQLPVYLKLSGFLFHSLLQIINDFLRIIFSNQLKNEDRQIAVEYQQSLLNSISEPEEQIKVESSKIWITGIEFELQIIKTCITHLNTNSGQGKKLLLPHLCQLANSVSQLSPTSELIDTIIEGGKFLLMNFYNKQIQHPLEKYEIYYFFQFLKWSLVNQLKQVSFVIHQSIKTIEMKSNYEVQRDWKLMCHYYHGIFKIKSQLLNQKNIKIQLIVWNFFFVVQNISLQNAVMELLFFEILNILKQQRYFKLLMNQISQSTHKVSLQKIQFYCPL